MLLKMLFNKHWKMKHINTSLENTLFIYVKRIKYFLQYCTNYYNLTDIPFNVSKEAMPKIGTIKIDEKNAEYRFHGKGLSLIWDNLEYYCSFDTSSSMHNIVISAYPFEKYIKQSNNLYSPIDIDYIENVVFPSFEDRGIFMKRKPKEMVFHVNEYWYYGYENGVEFDIETRNLIDWI